MLDPGRSGDDALWDVLLGSRGGRGGLRMMTTGGTKFSTWDEVFRDATRRSRVLRGMGVQRGSLVAAVLTNTYDSAVGLFAVWFAGASLASLPMRSRGMSRTEYQEQLRRIVTHCGSELILADGLGSTALLGVGADAVPVHPWSSLDATVAGQCDVTLPPSDAPVFVQYSSGSTGAPRGCLLSSRAIDEQQKILAEVTHVNRGDDVLCSWVPMSHDMGLFGGLLLGCYNDMEVALSTPERFMLSPRTWFADLSATGASITTGTSSALAMAVRAQRSPLPTPLKAHSVFIGAEMVEWSVLQTGTEAFAPSGLASTGLRTAYGMAEVTLTASVSPYGRPVRRVVLDREALEHQELVVLGDDAPLAQSVSVTSSGAPCPGTEVSVVNGAAIGELRIKSPSIADGYLGQADSEVFSVQDGVFQSRDLGFVYENEVYVLGRTDDLFIDAGRNVYLNEVELAVEDALNARKGRVFLVDVRDGPIPKLVALVELRATPKNPQELAGAVERTVMATCGVSVAASLFVAKGQLPMTPSGKKQRGRCRQLLQRKEFDVVAAGGGSAVHLL